jgi:formylglycine-generating enzyme required for sulfatase activity/serine/threonine protein kinase
MPWPLSQDYNEAIQTPAHCFADPELRQGEALTNALGLPVPCSGNFADVYAVTSGQRKWAVKCFTRQIPGLRERYQHISLYLGQVNLPFMVAFKFLEQGIRVQRDWYPILKMDWVEGITLNQFVRENLHKPEKLTTLSQIWLKLAQTLRQANIAHCDLQHGNVLLVRDRRAGALTLKLVDYDGMCVPALTLLKSLELGHPAYQHPQRLREGIYNLQVDRFSHLVIYTALRALVVGGSALWDRYDNGDNLLFTQADFEGPGRSPLFAELLRINDPQVRGFTVALIDAARKPLDQTPLLEKLVSFSPQVGIPAEPPNTKQRTRESILAANQLAPAPSSAGARPPAGLQPTATPVQGATARSPWDFHQFNPVEPQGNNRLRQSALPLRAIFAVGTLAAAVSVAIFLVVFLRNDGNQPPDRRRLTEGPNKTSTTDSRQPSQKDGNKSADLAATRFALKVEPAIVNISPGGKTTVQVSAIRKGYNGPIAVEIPDLPAGLTCAKVVIPAVKTRTAIEIVAAETAPEFKNKGVTVVGADLPDKKPIRSSPFTIVVVKPPTTIVVVKPPANVLPATFTNSLGMEFVRVPAGKSWLGGGGSKPADNDVVSPHDFYLGKYEVTQEQWQKVMGNNPSWFSRNGKGKDKVKDVSDEDLKHFPVEMVSWIDTQEFIKTLNENEHGRGFVYRLPTAVEWEYACRGGPMVDKSSSAFHYYFDKPTHELFPEQANFNHANGLKRTCKVGSYKPNGLGLYDMHGNTCEWCDDMGHSEYRTRGRGGAWSSHSVFCRAMDSEWLWPTERDYRFGFRLVQVPAGKATTKREQDSWIKRVAVLPPKQQVDAVTAKLKECNPGFSGKLDYKEQGGVVKEFYLHDGGRDLVDIWPVRAFPALRLLTCNFTGVSDLSPLTNMGLEELQISGSKVRDLTPLKGMPLTYFVCDYMNISDLSPLKGMGLKVLSCQSTLVVDLTPLRGMPLVGLIIDHTRVFDLTPLKDAKLASLDCRRTKVSDLSPLRSITTLKEINGQDAKLVWKEFDRLTIPYTATHYLRFRDRDRVEFLNTRGLLDLNGVFTVELWARLRPGLQYLVGDESWPGRGTPVNGSAGWAGPTHQTPRQLLPRA